jgi:hypothetical protein
VFDDAVPEEVEAVATRSSGLCRATQQRIRGKLMRLESKCQDGAGRVRRIDGLRVRRRRWSCRSVDLFLVKFLTLQAFAGLHFWLPPWKV